MATASPSVFSGKDDHATGVRPSDGWSIGGFGVICEFVRTADEPVAITRTADRIEIVTERGGMRVAPAGALHGCAWDSLSSDGEGWGQALACCVEQPSPWPDALRAGDRVSALLFTVMPDVFRHPPSREVSDVEEWTAVDPRTRPGWRRSVATILQCREERHPQRRRGRV